MSRLSPRGSLRLLAAGLLTSVGGLAGCDLGLGSDPYAGIADEPCMPGNTRVTGVACVVPPANIEVDGAIEDWAGVDVLPASGIAGPSGMLGLQVAQTSTDQVGPGLALRVVCANPDAASASWMIELSPIEEYPAAGSSRLVADAGLVRFYRGDYLIVESGEEGAPLRAAWTSDGFEVWVARALIAYRGGVGVYAHPADSQASPGGATMKACWEGDSLLDPCRQ